MADLKKLTDISKNVEDRRGEHWASKAAAVVTSGFDWDNFKDDLKNPFTTRENRRRDPKLESSQLAKDAGGDDISAYRTGQQKAY